MKKCWIPLIVVLTMLFGSAATGCQQVQQVETKASIAVGTWVDTEKIAEKDNQPHPVKYRIDSITRDQAIVNEAISSYNLSGTGTLIEKTENSNLEFCVASYSVIYPKDFPREVFGITDVAIPFDIVSLTGGTIQVEDTVYKNLGTTWEIGKQPQGYDFHPGDTYQGQIVFMMIKGYSEYLIHQINAEAGDAQQVYIRGQ